MLRLCDQFSEFWASETQCAELRVTALHDAPDNQEKSPTRRSDLTEGSGASRTYRQNRVAQPRFLWAIAHQLASLGRCEATIVII